MKLTWWTARGNEILRALQFPVAEGTSNCITRHFLLLLRMSLLNCVFGFSNFFRFSGVQKIWRSCYGATHKGHLHMELVQGPCARRRLPGVELRSADNLILCVILCVKLFISQVFKRGMGNSSFLSDAGATSKKANQRIRIEKSLF